MDASATIKKFGLEQAFHYMYKDPEKNLSTQLHLLPLNGRKKPYKPIMSICFPIRQSLGIKTHGFGMNCLL